MYQKILCPAKINLFLEVLGKREDGYHELDTVMHSVNLCDTVGVEVNENGSGANRIELTCTDADLPTDSRNIAYRAAEAFAGKYGINGFDIKIDIEKRIPVAAGLAGGSTDCAGVLLMLESLFGTSDREGLLELGKSLGADVPFCMTCGCAKASGVGDILTRVEPITPEWTLVIAKGERSVSTKDAYAEIDRLEDRGIRTSAPLISRLEKGDVYSLSYHMFNRFEEIYEKSIPEVSTAKKLMIEGGALASMMSGSGPSVFGIFADYDEADNVRRALAGEGYSAFLCLPLM